MAIKALQKSSKVATARSERKISRFIAQGGSLQTDVSTDHRLTVRIPQWLMAKIDTKRKERVGTISRNLFILETLDKATKKD